MSKYTDWYPPEIKPVHIGYYQCRCCGGMFWWNGAYWQDSEDAIVPEEKINEGWRGLKEKAE